MMAIASAPAELSLVLAPNASVERDGDALLVRCGAAFVRIEHPAQSVADAIRMLSGRDATESAMMGASGEVGDLDAALQMTYAIAQLLDQGLIRYGVRKKTGELFATVEIFARRFDVSPRVMDPSTPHVFSRFALMRREGGSAVIESPLVSARLVLHDPAAAAVCGAIATGKTLEELITAVPAVDACVVEEFLALLIALDMTEDDGQNERMKVWEFHDLLFHARSRLGRHANGYGGTYRFGDALSPEPLIRSRTGADTVALPLVDLAAVTRRDPLLTQAIESRTSVREYGDQAIGLAQLGEFLYRSARVRSIVAGDQGEIASRPYPSGGAIYEQEIYVAVERCTGLEPGLYRYAAEAHGLDRIAPLEGDVARVIDGGWRAANQPESRPQVMIIVTARFSRVMYKYGSVAYALILKNLGALLQTMYLVATAMQLAPCALGGGDSDLFARAAKLDYYAETSIGEFMLGTRPDGAS